MGISESNFLKMLEKIGKLEREVEELLAENANLKANLKRKQNVESTHRSSN